MPDDHEKKEAAARAVVHLLRLIKHKEEVRYQIGFGTQAYQLLTEAAAALFDEPIEKVKENYPG